MSGKRLPALRDAGYTVSIISPTGPRYEKRYERIDGIHVFRHRLPLEANSTPGFVVEYASALAAELRLSWKVFRKVGFSIVHACNPPDMIFVVGAIYKYLFGCRFIFDHHDLGPEMYLAKGGTRRSVIYGFLRLAERLTFGVADVSIATNESYRQVAVERGRMDPAKVFVVRSGPDLSRVRIIPPDPSVRQGARFLVGYLGVMGNEEGIPYLLEAARLIVVDRGRTDIHFALVGGGPELENMRALAQELGIDSFVTFTGRVPDDELLRVLNTADVCVNPDVFSEMNDKSTMNKILEYMALAKPIVQFHVKEGRVRAGNASLYATPNDASDFASKITDLIDDPAGEVKWAGMGLAVSPLPFLGNTKSPTCFAHIRP